MPEVDVLFLDCRVDVLDCGLGLCCLRRGCICDVV